MAAPKLPGDLTWPKLLGTCLAAVTTAWVAGSIGFSNAITGAAVGSIVATIASVSDAKAAAALREAGGDVKPAVLIACGAASMSEAVNWLAAAEGRIDDALRRARVNGIKGEGPNKGA